MFGCGAGATEIKTVMEGFQMTENGLRVVGSGMEKSGAGKTPGTVVGIASLLATHNPVGLIVSSGIKIHAERRGSSKLDGRVTATVKEVTKVLKKRFEAQGWIAK